MYDKYVKTDFLPDDFLKKIAKDTYDFHVSKVYPLNCLSVIQIVASLLSHVSKN